MVPPIFTFQGTFLLPEDLKQLEPKLSQDKDLVVKSAFRHAGVVITSYEFLRSDPELFRGG
jgi:hypothetical protein